MPKLSIYMIRAALIHMAIGFLFGATLLFHKGVALFTWTWQLLAPHIELMVFGWTMQLIMGVAFFLLPRFSTHETRYGAVKLGWLAFILLNIGVSLSITANLISMGWLMLIGRLLTVVGVIAFVAMIVPRVKAYGQ